MGSDCRFTKKCPLASVSQRDIKLYLWYAFTHKYRKAIMWSNEQLCYFAGIIDGEGSIGIEHLKPTKGRKKDYYTCRLTVINTSFTLMRWIKENFGGTFDTRKAILGRKVVYRWHIFGKNMDAILQAIFPFLIIKKIQAHIQKYYRDRAEKKKIENQDAFLSTKLPWDY